MLRNQLSCKNDDLLPSSLQRESRAKQPDPLRTVGKEEFSRVWCTDQWVWFTLPSMNLKNQHFRDAEAFRDHQALFPLFESAVVFESLWVKPDLPLCSPVPLSAPQKAAPLHHDCPSEIENQSPCVPGALSFLSKISQPFSQGPQACARAPLCFPGSWAHSILLSTSP